MNDQTPQSDDRLERTLRRWGAETAARRESRHLPIEAPAAPPGGGAVWTLLRGMAVAAAAVIVFAAGMFVYRIINPASGRLVEGRVEAPASSPAEADVQRLKDDLAGATESLTQAAQTLAKVQGELKTTREDLAKATGDAKAAADEHAGQIDQLKADFRKQLASAAAASPNAVRLEGQVKTLTAELADAKKRLAEAEAAVVRVQGEAEARNDALAKRLAAATAELHRVTEAMQRNADATRAAAQELAALRAAQTTTLTRFRNLYLAGAAPELHGLAAQQAAARKGQLLRRVASARSTTKSESTRRLLDRVETVLTRLELLNPDDARDAEAFGRMVSGDLLEQIDAALVAGETPSVQAVLLEARIILTEGDHVG